MLNNDLASKYSNITLNMKDLNFQENLHFVNIFIYMFISHIYVDDMIFLKQISHIYIYIHISVAAK